MMDKGNFMEFHMLGRLLLATFLGLCIGIERQYHGRVAGIRTFSSIALGTSLLTIFNLHFFPSEHSSTINAAIIIGLALVSARTNLAWGNNEEDHQDFSNIVALWSTGAIAICTAYGLYILAAGAAFLLLAIYLLKDFFEEITKRPS